MIGDGNCTTKSIRFCTASDAIKKEMERAVNYFDCDLIQYKSNRDIDYNIIKRYNKNNRMFENGYCWVTSSLVHKWQNIY